MIKSTITSMTLRLYKDESAVMYVTDYDAIINVTFLSSNTVFLSGFKGEVNRKMLRQMYRWFVAEGIEYILATRSPLHSLFCATEILPGIQLLKISDLESRVSKKPAGPY